MSEEPTIEQAAWLLGNLEELPADAQRLIRNLLSRRRHASDVVIMAAGWPVVEQGELVAIDRIGTIRIWPESDYQEFPREHFKVYLRPTPDRAREAVFDSVRSNTPLGAVMVGKVDQLGNIIEPLEVVAVQELDPPDVYSALSDEPSSFLFNNIVAYRSGMKALDSVELESVNSYTQDMSGNAHNEGDRLRQEFREELAAIRAEFRQDVRDMRSDLVATAKNTQDRLDAFREESRTTLDVFRKENRDSLDAFRTETRAQFTAADQKIDKLTDVTTSHTIQFAEINQKVDKLTDITTSHTIQFAEIKASIRTATWIVGAIAAAAGILSAIAAFG